MTGLIIGEFRILVVSHEGRNDLISFFDLEVLWILINICTHILLLVIHCIYQCVSKDTHRIGGIRNLDLVILSKDSHARKLSFNNAGFGIALFMVC